MSAPPMKLSLPERMIRPRGRDLLEHERELVQRLAREGVGRLALLVEGEPGEVVAVLLPAPMFRQDLRIDAFH
jgi:hypothetical protein